MEEIVVELCITADAYLQHYRGVRQVSAVAVDGRSIVFPASCLRPFVTRSGIRGVFCFSIGGNGKLQRVTKLQGSA